MARRTLPREIVTIAALGAFALAGCSSDSGYGGTTPPDGSSPDTTASSGAGGPTISNFAFSLPAGLTAGTPFTVTNDDGTTHTFTNPDGAFDVTVPAGGTAEVTVAAAGTYQVVCKIHSSMSATLTIG